MVGILDPADRASARETLAKTLNEVQGIHKKRILVRWGA